MKIIAMCLIAVTATFVLFWHVVQPVIGWRVWRHSKWHRLGHRSLPQWYKATLRTFLYNFDGVRARLPEENIMGWGPDRDWLE